MLLKELAWTLVLLSTGVIGNVSGISNFKLYTSTKVSDFKDFDSKIIQDTTFSDKKLAVICHGYTENGDSEWMRDMANALLKLKNINVITVNWGDLSSGVYQWVVLVNMPKAVDRVLDLVKKIIKKKEPKTENIHLIGFSLGSHIMGRIGRKLKDAGKEVGRITGLDPAGPLFERWPVNNRLDASHAVFVDAIHTDTRLVRLEKLVGLEIKGTLFGIGTNMRMAKNDFYPNDGFYQPGCKNVTVGFLINPFISNKQKIDRAVCNHIRSVLLFTESIGNKNAFKAKRCDDSKIFGREDQKLGEKICVEPANQMGYFTDKSEEGAFYVKTKNSPPFAYEAAPPEKKTKRQFRIG